MTVPLCRGGFGEVFPDGTYAYKKARGTSDDAKTQECAERYLRNEAKALKDLQHDGVVKFIRFDEDPLQLVLELMQGKDLFNAINDCDHIDVIYQTAKVVCYFHEMGYVHCDISINNVRIIDRTRVKAFDLGCTRVEGSCGDWGKIDGSICPEHVLGLKVTKSWDVWDMGVILADMVLADEDFDISKVLHRRAWFLKRDKDDPNDFHCFLRSMILCNISLRTNLSFESVKDYFHTEACEEARGHHKNIWQFTTEFHAKTWLKMTSPYPCVEGELLKGMLQVDPRERPSAKELLRDPLFAKYQ